MTASLVELQEWQDIAKVREDKIKELELINQNLRHENRTLNAVCWFHICGNSADSLQQSIPSNEAISGTEIYKALTKRIFHLEHTLKEKETQTKLPAPEDPKLPSPSESNDEEQVSQAFSSSVL